MRAFVFTDSSLARHAVRFVWLEVDVEKPKNAAFRKRFPVQALPTFFVVDPADEQVAVRWVGGFTVAQLEQLIAGDLLAAKRASGGLEARLARADSLYGAGDNAAAIAAYEEVLDRAPAGWPGYARTAEALLFALSSEDRAPRCVALAREAMSRLRGQPTTATAAAYGLDCALTLPASDSTRAAAVAEFEAAARGVLADTSIRIAADNRSSLYGSLVSARDDAGDEAGHRRVAGEWARYLEGEAARARTPEQRAVFDSHRLSAYLEMGEPERAIGMLEQSRRDFPDDYNPPARLALAYTAMHRWADALQASDEAMAKVYGPRKLRVFDNRAEILAGAGDSTAARRTLEAAVQYAEGLPPGQRSAATIESFRKKLAKYH